MRSVPFLCLTVATLAASAAVRAVKPARRLADDSPGKRSLSLGSDGGVMSSSGAVPFGFARADFEEGVRAARKRFSYASGLNRNGASRNDPIEDKSSRESENRQRERRGDRVRAKLVKRADNTRSGSNGDSSGSRSELQNASNDESSDARDMISANSNLKEVDTHESDMNRNENGGSESRLSRLLNNRRRKVQDDDERTGDHSKADSVEENAERSECPSSIEKKNQLNRDQRGFEESGENMNEEREGADMRNNPVAQDQDRFDDQANDSADEGKATKATGGVGGVDPATGEELLPLPEISDFCEDSGSKQADGTQIRDGFCSSISQGEIPSADNMVSSLIVMPDNAATLGKGKDFEVVVHIRNMKTGFFTVAATEYYTQPQSLNNKGFIKGHSHITIQKLNSKTTAPNANQKVFFKGLNNRADEQGELSLTVPGSAMEEDGLYRICSMAGSFSHQPVIMPIAQRGAQDDCIRVTVE